MAQRGLIGGSAPAGQGDAQPRSAGDWLALVGGWAQNLQDAANGTSGPSHISEAGQLIAARQQEAQKKAQIDQILGQVLGTNAPGVGTADIVKPPQAMIGRGPGFMPQSAMPGPMGPLPPGVTPQLPTRDEINMPGVASMSGGVDLGAPVKQPTPMGLDNPQLPALALAAKRAGLDLSSYIDILKANKPAEPKVIEGPDGIYREDGKGGFVKVQPYAPTVSAGWRQKADGSGWEPVPGGPADPSYIARTSGVRRDAVTSRPMPRASKAVNPNAIKWD